MQIRLIFLLLLLCLPVTELLAQSQPEVPEQSLDGKDLQAIRLDELARLLQKKVDQKVELEKTQTDKTEELPADKQTVLSNLNRDIGNLSAAFEMIALSNTDTALLNDPDAVKTDWRQDLLDILNPLIESLKSITKRPRQVAEARDTVYRSEAQLQITHQAVSELEAIPADSLDANAASRIADLLSKWQDEQAQYEQHRLVAQTQLERLSADQETFFQGVWPATRLFLLGRGLTLAIAMAAAFLTWAVMRFLWWMYTIRFTTKDQRRNSTWFRLLAYSFYLVTTLITVFVILVVLYVREDLLLLALAFLVIVAIILGLRQYLPRYVREARLLLNLGAVREDERVIYNGLPWQIESLNLYTVLRNPALDGVIRLPLDVIATLVSRPVKNNLWFPSNRGDYVILPDTTFGQIKCQTPDLVEISIRGGMSMTYNTQEFYAINLINLSRDETFGVSVTFGFDYSLQSISLTEIPQTLEREVRKTLHDANYEMHINKLIVELANANTSSLDFLVFAMMSSTVASDYFKLHRLIQQSCVAVANENGWTIPFPQLTIHQPATR
ncbi:hypothetical protein [Granulosicoccus antarcticus]|uniref:Mechanosensitive ion channel n=1 Tax=Granulosicoccus antarcticus IMCC3135 TaxID=1192854 RepID=A0A2Z2NLA4_9GAMM|nr:hypothetical protein [Granulosicoccus antarcticus]ASJ70761.1 hypothetical protein IMCC3135_03240 [Granulosicoccus antarcticus IMCC3135]